MATTFVQPPPQNIHSPPHHFGQATYQQHSTPPSNNVSPTSHSSYLHARQVRQPKQPLYIPAVYRPTEVSSRQSSLTPPRSANNSMDSTDGSVIKFALPNSPPLSPDEDLDRSYAPWGQASITRVVTDEWNEDVLGTVTGAPTRNHWKPDTSTEICTSPSCNQSFSFFARRHHCRRCGNIFCSAHTPHAVPLDQEARFHPEGTPQRSCDDCHNDYRAWRASRTSRTNSVISKGSHDTATMPVGVPINRDVVDESNQQNTVGSVAQSFGYSQWSTF